MNHPCHENLRGPTNYPREINSLQATMLLRRRSRGALVVRLVRSCRVLRHWITGTAEIANASRIAARKASMLLVFKET